MKRNLLFLLFVLFVLSCTVKIRIPKENQNKQTFKLYADKLVFARYPQYFTATQRILLTVGGKDYDFIGYLNVGPNGDFRAVALGEMGGTFLDLKQDSGRVMVVKNPSGLPENPILEGVAGDINLLFNFKPETFCGQFSKEDSTFLFDKMQANHLNQIGLKFKEDTLRYSCERQNDKIVRKVAYQNYQLYDAIKQVLPAQIVLENKKWHYKMRIQLLSIKEKTEN